MEIIKIKKIIEKTLNQNKAKNIIAISLRGKSSIADYMIIASGTSSRHLQSLSEILVTELKKIGLDIFDKYDEQFSFDLEIFAKYSPKGKNLNSIKAARLTRDVDANPIQQWYSPVNGRNIRQY